MDILGPGDCVRGGRQGRHRLTLGMVAVMVMAACDKLVISWWYLAMVRGVDGVVLLVDVL